ncbi:MAG: hypothetical protein ABFS37_04260 [Acidobacteriota bacterium]
MNTKKFPSVLWVLALTIFAACGGQTVAIADQIPSSPDGTVRFVAEKVADGHPEVIWEALPPTYRNDINGLTHLFATKVDAEVWDKSFGVLRKAAVVLQDQKDLFLGSKMFAMAEDKQDEITDNWDTGTLVFSTLVNSDIGNLKSLETIDWGQFMATTGAQLMEVAKKASAATEENDYENEFLAKVKGMDIEVLEKTDTTAKLKISAPDEEPEEIQMTKVEGRWVPTDMATDWDTEVAEARTNLEEITPETIAQQKMQIMMMVGMAEAFVDQVAQAKTSEELDQMLQGLLGGLLGGAMGGPPPQMDDAPAENEAPAE